MLVYCCVFDDMGFVTRNFMFKLPPGRVAQSVCLTADRGVASLIPARSHTFVEIEPEIISTSILFPSAESKCAQSTVKFAHEKSVVR